MRGEENFRYRQDTLKHSRAASTGEGSADAELPDVDTELLVTAELRLQLAKYKGVPAYVVFTDRSLVDMARRKPAREDEFAEVHGVGAAKLRDFAEPFLAAINETD